MGKNKTYTHNVEYLKKSWIRYPIPRERMLRRAADWLGYPSYQLYMRKYNPEKYAYWSEWGYQKIMERRRKYNVKTK